MRRVPRSKLLQGLDALTECVLPPEMLLQIARWKRDIASCKISSFQIRKIDRKLMREIREIAPRSVLQTDCAKIKRIRSLIYERYKLMYEEDEAKLQKHLDQYKLILDELEAGCLISFQPWKQEDNSKAECLMRKLQELKFRYLIERSRELEKLIQNDYFLQLTKLENANNSKAINEILPEITAAEKEHAKASILREQISRIIERISSLEEDMNSDMTNLKDKTVEIYAANKKEEFHDEFLEECEEDG